MNSKDLIEKYGIRPNKALGQNFLVDENAIRLIVGLAAEPGLPLLEIGPGLGALTFPLADTGLPVAAVELDSVLAGILGRELPGNARVINADFLKCDLAEAAAFPDSEGVTVVGNLPYYITSPIVMRLVTSKLPIKRMALMVQKEAADRFFAVPGDKNYVPLTVASRLLFDIRPVLELSPSSYYPQPEVSSSVLLFESKDFSLPEGFSRFLSCAFAMRRKTLANNLASMGLGKAEAAELIESVGLSRSVRAEALEPSRFIGLFERINSRF